MRRALELAMHHRPHPNPRVGSVVVAPNGVVIGEGSHVSPGEDHAELVALRAAGSAAAGSTLYVTLEPCPHEGRTPPCVDEIIRRQVRRVVVAVGDPDPRVSGEGIRRLQDAGIEVVEGLFGERARRSDPGYFHHRETGLPRVTIKYAMTLDGSAAAADHTSQWITSSVAREDAHRLRSENDAIVVGAGTLRSDDPRLDVRLTGYEGPQPRPVIVTGTGELPQSARIWERNPLVVATSETTLPGGEPVVVAGNAGLPDPQETCGALAELGHLDILVEGGPTITRAWLEANVITGGVVYVGGKLGGGKGIPPLGGVFETIDDAMPVSIAGMRSLGTDVRIDFQLE